MWAAFWEGLLSPLRPNFAADAARIGRPEAEEHRRGLTLTFELISGLVKILVVLTIVWAVAAGFLQAGRLIAYIPHGYPSNNVHGFWADWVGWFAPLVGVLIYPAKAVGVTLLVGLAAALVGGFLGFLFGVPRRISEASAPSAQATAPGAPGGGPSASGPLGSRSGTQPAREERSADQISALAAAPTATASAGASSSSSSGATATVRGGNVWESSTNLTQVSDWLTKIIVGVGLVEAKSIYETFAGVSNGLSGQLFDGAAGSRLVIPAVMVAGIIIGFLYAYLFTQLFVAGLMVRADYGLVVEDQSRIDAALTTISAVASGSAAIAPPLGDGQGERLPRLDRPTEAQRRAAGIVSSLDPDSISDPQRLLAWARSRAMQDDYAEAADGYRRVLTLLRTPEVLAEAARVFNAAKLPDEAKDALSAAVRNRASVSPEVRTRISFDAASSALYDDPPMGYQRALEVLDEHTLENDPRGFLHVLHACALGQRYHYEKNLSSTERKELRDAALADVREALFRDRNNRDWIHYLWDRSHSDKPPVGSSNRDDDLEPFFDDPEFRDLLVSKRAAEVAVPEPAGPTTGPTGPGATGSTGHTAALGPAGTGPHQ